MQHLYKEEILHFVWQFQYFDQQELMTSSRLKLQIIKPGMINANSGPDFFNARIKINEIEWAGNIEIHWKASEWNQHGHEQDEAYANVILHVVFEEDTIIYNHLGEVIPTLVLKNRINTNLLFRYQQMLKNKYFIPCERLLHNDLPYEGLTLFIEKLMIERLEQKTSFITQILHNNRWDWEDALYKCILRAYGFKINAEPFFQLALQLPLKIIVKHQYHIHQLEALLFGQAGLLQKELNDPYLKKIKSEYNYISKKYSLQPMSISAWKYSRLRPSNFPDVRIAQLAAFLHHQPQLLSRMIELKTLDQARQFFTFPVSEYWLNHHILDGNVTPYILRLGKSSIDVLITNVVVPFLFLYGKERGNETLVERSFYFLQSMHEEKNNIIQQWKKLGFQIQNAFESQAFLHLKNNYCDTKRCLHCVIGHQLLKKTV